MAQPDRLQVTVLGSGTSTGVPTIGCSCAVCHSADPRDRRLRPSIMMEFAEGVILVDVTPDFRAQALRAPIPRIDAVLCTHSHADHIMGLDDVRPFNYMQESAIPIYGSAETLAVIRRTFSYVFETKETQSTIPKLKLVPIDEQPFRLLDRDIVPVRVMHGPSVVYGFRIGSFAYLTDHSEIPEESLAKLHNLDVLFLDALRHRPHPTHSNLEQALAYAARIQARQTFFTHMSHEISYAAVEATLPSGVHLAYDGLRIDVGAGA